MINTEQLDELLAAYDAASERLETARADYGWMLRFGSGLEIIRSHRAYQAAMHAAHIAEEELREERERVYALEDAAEAAEEMTG